MIALSKTRHFGRAAEMVHVSQPALSVQIREMEQRLGTQLFLRDAGSPITLTPAGQDVLRTARRIMLELEQLEENLRWGDGLKGRLRLGLIPTVAPYLLPVALPLLQRLAPSLDLRVREAKTDALISDLADGRIDAAVLALPAPATGLETLPLFQDRFLLAGDACRVRAFASSPVPPEPAALDPQDLLLLEEGHCLADQALEVCNLSRDTTQTDLSASSLSTLCGLAAAGFGLTLLPEIAFQTEQAASPELSVLRFAPPEAARDIAMVRRSGLSGGTWFEELGDILVQAATPLLEHTRARIPPAP